MNVDCRNVDILLCCSTVSPMFQSANLQPQNVRATEGDSVSFFCRTDAKPTAAVTWYRDGIELQGECVCRAMFVSARL